MSYDSTRDAEQLRIITPSIDAFANRYNNNTQFAANGGRHTIFLFPGGMASVLQQATSSYVDGVSTPQLFNYETLWIEPLIFFDGRAADLRLNRISSAEYRDENNQIIVADGCVEFLGCTPYSGFTDWCEQSGFDYFVFGWDWRRKLQHSGKFFIEKFLPFFQARVKSKCNNADPLAKFSLIGHSAGGMVVNWIFRKNHANTANMYRAITVATPFYGYASQMHRWFEGEPYVNGLGGAYKTKVIKAICSAPAAYTWLYLDEQTFKNNEPALGNDPHYPLPTYPCVDATTTSVRADPYNPQTNGSLTRYPSAVQSGFSLQELKDARQIVRHLASGFDPALPLSKFFNVRCDNGANDTAGSSTWKWVPPTNPSPIVDVSSVAGDDTQPGWSTRHVGLAATNPDQVRTVYGSDVGHMFTMNSPHTIEEVGKILGVLTPAMVQPLQLNIASSEEALAFVRSIQRKFPKGARRVADKERLREELAKSSSEQLRRIARRIMIDLLRPPLRDPESGGGKGRRSKKSAGSRKDKEKRSKK
jgi:hypothetical protein